MKLERWLKEVKPKVRSKLDAHTEEIATLRERGYTQLQIVEFLRLNGIKTTQKNISFFLDRKVKNKAKKSEIETPKSQEPKTKIEVKEEVKPKTQKLEKSESENKIQAHIDYALSHGVQKSESMARLKELLLAAKKKP